MPLEPFGQHCLLEHVRLGDMVQGHIKDVVGERLNREPGTT